MDCEKCSMLLIDYLDDALTPDEAGALKEHLDTCPDCSLELEHYREIRTAARMETAPEPSPEVLSQISEAAKKSSKTLKAPFWKKWSYSPILVPTISAAIALSVWLYYGQTGFENAPVVTRDVGAMKMKSMQDQDTAFDESNEERLMAGQEALEDKEATLETAVTREQEKPPSESRIQMPSTPGVSERAPGKSMLRKKDVTEEDFVTYREDTPADLSEPSSNDTKTEEALRAEHPILPDYRGQLELAQRQQTEGDCALSIKTNVALLASSPAPPKEVQASSYKSLAECYEKTGNLSKAVSSYESMARLDPTQADFVNHKLAEIKVDAEEMKYDAGDAASEPAN